MCGAGTFRHYDDDAGRRSAVEHWGNKELSWDLNSYDLNDVVCKKCAEMRETMEYNNIVEGIFLERPNRFVADIEINGKVERCHVKNTGRCREILIPGISRVYLEDWGEKAGRKTRYDLVTVKKGDLMVNMDSQAPNKLMEEWIAAGGLFPDITFWKREQRFQNSRFDFYLEQKAEGKTVKTFLEVKGVTLEEGGIARFPDAPTERGVKHIRELIRARAEGYEAMLAFVVQMKGMKWVEPNNRTHPEFGQALSEAVSNGVKVVALSCDVEPERVKINGEKLEVKWGCLADQSE